MCWTIFPAFLRGRGRGDVSSAGLGEKRTKPNCPEGSCKLWPRACWDISHAWQPFSAGLALEQVCLQDSNDRRCEWHRQTSVRFEKHGLQWHDQVCQEFIWPLNSRGLASSCWKTSGVGTEGEHRSCHGEMMKLLDWGGEAGPPLRLHILNGMLKLEEIKAWQLGSLAAWLRTKVKYKDLDKKLIVCE